MGRFKNKTRGTDKMKPKQAIAYQNAYFISIIQVAHHLFYTSSIAFYLVYVISIIQVMFLQVELL
jgi:hypothetical protein